MPTTFSANTEDAFQIHSIHCLKENRDLLDSPQRNFSHQIVWMTSGSGHYCIDTEKYSLTDNTIYFVPPGCIQRLHAESDLRGYTLSFNGDLFQLAVASPNRQVCDDMISGFSRVNIIPLRDSSAEHTLKNLLQEMMQELAAYRILRSETLAALLKVFLICLRRMALPLPQQSIPSKTVSLLNDFNSRLEKSYLTKRSVAEYASDLSVTPNYLTEVVKRLTGRSAGQHIQERRVLEAKRLAIYSGDSMKGIAYKLGFEDTSHFSKFFKNVAGINFSEFKKQQNDAANGSLLRLT